MRQVINDTHVIATYIPSYGAPSDLNLVLLQITVRLYVYICTKYDQSSTAMKS